MRSDFQRRARLVQRRGRRGLTLVELLVAISVLAVVAVMGWRGLDTIVRSRAALIEEMEQTRGLQLAFAQMQNDCAQIASPVLLQNRQVLRIDNARLSLVRTVQTEGQPLRAQVVTYLLAENVLTRQEMPATRDLREIDAQLQSVSSGMAAAYSVALQPGVSSLALRLWAEDKRGWRSADVPDGEQGQQTSSGKAQVIAQGSGIPVARVAYTGLEMTLRLAGRDAPMQKIFLLGAV
ncbi:type II secretion system protein J [Lacisediminimonas sp.]|uniref:PulJ/GspJ family protein n=1 Tax=Lacisediminimonas sp. TaxID=3060582 RepID=UPI0027156F90|nr:prepilin-type N-terminal cleavage/methylation domain-containing protein [Lacisediminimonas sp.]MDO8301228.1 prepilin-type N-terminal cleavage/methylation domain-containing protein [Lacisediminimonas sp.]